jgi:hypothetical protein
LTPRQPIGDAGGVAAALELEPGRVDGELVGTKGRAYIGGTGVPASADHRVVELERLLAQPGDLGIVGPTSIRAAAAGELAELGSVLAGSAERRHAALEILVRLGPLPGRMKSRCSGAARRPHPWPTAPTCRRRRRPSIRGTRKSSCCSRLGLGP